MLSVSTSNSGVRGATRPYHHGRLRQALLAEALAVLAEGEPSSLSLRELARRLGVSHAAPYRHFADKDALLAAVAQQGFELLTAELEAAAAPHPQDALRQLADTGWIYVRFALHHPQHFQVMFGMSAVTQAAFPDLRAAGLRAFEVLLHVIERGQRAGQVVPGEPYDLATSAWAQVHGLAMLLRERQLAADGDLASEALVRRCIQIHHAGLAVMGAAHT
jgi:AcrR family transcriptional regulator